MPERHEGVEAAPAAASPSSRRHPDDRARARKVLVWDLDDTLWEGTLAEGDAVRLRPGVEVVLRTLDRRGILHSVASRNDVDHAMKKLQELGVAEYFLYPQIGWSAKSMGIRRISESINVGLDSIAFIDDQPFEREEVVHALPEVQTFEASMVESLPDRPEFTPLFVTDESAMRRRMYQADIQRNEAEEEFVGAQEDFLATLDMRLTIEPAREEDLKRAEELTVRTNQLNATGYTYSYDELNDLRRSPDHLLLVAGLTDKYGPYGKIGLALVETQSRRWNLKLLLMSCRVMSRGVGTILLNYVLGLAREAGVEFQAEFRPTGRNRLMLITYRFAGFEEAERREDGLVLFRHDLRQIQEAPAYVRTSAYAT